MMMNSKSAWDLLRSKFVKLIKRKTKKISEKYDDILLEKYGKPILIAVKKSNKAKRTQIKINHKNIQLILPLMTDIKEGHDFLHKKEKWIREKLKKKTSFLMEEIPENSTLLLGKCYQINNIIAKTHSIKLNEDEIIVSAQEGKHKEVLQNFLKDMLLQEVRKLAEQISLEYGLNYSKINISNALHKWGSCSSKGILSFNYVLCFAPPKIIEYVVVHEMCHLKEMNHSKNFWALVQHLYPDHKEARVWLKKHGNFLMQLMG